MPTIAVTNDIRLSQAIIRFLRFSKQDSYTPADFNLFKKNCCNKMESFSEMIMDVYENFDGKAVSTGLQYGMLFEKNEKRITYFYTVHGSKKNLTIQDLTPNCFYLPTQLSEFLSYIRNMKPVPGSSSFLQNCFLSGSITNDHK